MIKVPELSDSSVAVLGLIAIRPTSGYDLAAFADRSIAYFWSIPRSQLYRELARLEKLDLIVGTHVAQRSAPDKRIYEITDRPAARFGRLTARWGVLHAEASLAWLDEAEALVTSRSDSDANSHSPAVQ